MRVLITTDAVGGVWDHSLTLVAALRQIGTDAVIAVCGPRPSDAQRHEAADVAPLVHVDAPLEWMPGGAEAVRSVQASLRDAVVRHKIDVVHANSYSHVLADVPTLLGAHSTLHGWWQAVHGARPAPAAWEPYRNIVAAALQEARAVVAPTQAMLDELRLYAEPKNGMVVPNGIAGASTVAVTAEGRTHPAAGILRDATHRSQRFVLTSGRLWDEGKGQRYLDAAAAGLPWPVMATGSARGPTGEMRFANLELTGWLTRKELARLQAQASLYVNPALYEPFGLGALEAAACGTPLLLSELPSHREVWGQAAAYVPPGDADALAAAVREIMGDDESRAELAGLARQRAATYTAEAMADAYHRLYSTEETICTT